MYRVGLVPAWSLHAYILVSFMLEDTLQAVERSTWTQMQSQNPWSTICPVNKICWERTCGSDQTRSGLTWGPYSKRERERDHVLHCLDSHGLEIWYSPETKGKAEHSWKEINGIIPLDILLYSLIGGFFNCHQRCFLQQQMGVGSETHSQTVCEEKS